VPSINSVLDIAKEALLAHQLSIQVAANNVANVDTPGYSRQVLTLAGRAASPSAVGQVGNGVLPESILRQFDQFMAQRLVGQQSTQSNAEAQQDAMQVVEALFNETSGQGLNDLMTKFWQSWQSLANNPENLSAKQSVVQTGQLLQDHLGQVYTQIVDTRNNLGVQLDSAVSEINSLTRKIAGLNVQITTSESPGRTANDLRDQRDSLVKDLAGFLDITYFENKGSGAYSILLTDGHPLVDATEANRIALASGQLQWINQTSSGQDIRLDIGAGAEVGGKVGGWLEVYNDLVSDNPDNIMGQLDSFATSLIQEVNQLHAQGVGSTAFSTTLTGSSVAENAAVLTTTVDATQATTDIAAGTFQINGREIGVISGGVALHGLAMTKAANAVDAVNAAVNSVTARLTTLTAGGTVTGLAAGETVAFTVNGMAVTYTAGAAPESANTTATNVVAAINAQIAAYNLDPTKAPAMSLTAVVGDGSNGGAVDAIVMRNTNAGDQSAITIAGIDTAEDAKLALANGIAVADLTHNTGQTTLVAGEQFSVSAGPTDTFLTQLGMGGGLYSGDTANDGNFTYSYDNPGGVSAALLGFPYGQDLATDNGSLDIWLYGENGAPLLPEPVTVPLDRVYTLQDVASAINVAITNASGGQAWLTAAVNGNKLRITPATGLQFAFANDTANILQTAGLNTFFTGHNVATLAVNDTLAQDASKVTAGRVGTQGEIFAGDNTNALGLAGLQFKEEVKFANGDTTSLDGYYNSLVGKVGSRVQSLNRDVELNTLLSKQLNDMRDSISGVSLDEEMANLIKYQQAYTAAAKLIATSDQMLNTLINSLQR